MALPRVVVAMVVWMVPVFVVMMLVAIVWLWLSSRLWWILSISSGDFHIGGSGGGGCGSGGGGGGTDSAYYDKTYHDEIVEWLHMTGSMLVCIRCIDVSVVVILLWIRCIGNIDNNLVCAWNRQLSWEVHSVKADYFSCSPIISLLTIERVIFDNVYNILVASSTLWQQNYLLTSMLNLMVTISLVTCSIGEQFNWLWVV